MASKKKVRKNVVKGIVVVTASFNNTMITVTDVNTSAKDCSIREPSTTTGFKVSSATPPAASTPPLRARPATNTPCNTLKP